MDQVFPVKRMTASFTRRWFRSTNKWTIDPVQYKYGTGTNERHGVSCPNWADKIRNGADATTPFSGILSKLYTVPMGKTWMETYTNISGGWILDSILEQNGLGYNPNAPNTSSISTTAADAQAQRKATQKLLDLRAQVQGMIFLGELGETIRMIKSPAKTLRQSVSTYFWNVQRRTSSLRLTLNAQKAKRVGRFAVNTKRQGVIRQLNKILSDTWLEFSFGARPLFKDIQDGYQAYLTSMGKVNGLRERISASWNDGNYSSYGTDSSDLGAGVQCIRYTRYSGGAKVRYLYFLDFSAQGWTPPDTFTAFGFDVVDQFLPTVWELCPWSFFIDYFTNIGDWINAGAVCSSAVTFGVKTTRKYMVLEQGTLGADVAYMNAHYPYPRYRWGCLPESAISTCVTVNRQPLGSFSRPTFRVGFQGSTSRWLNIAALNQQYGSLLGKFRSALRR